MSASGLHAILGEGDEDTWKKFTMHSHSFLFAAVKDQEQVTSMHKLEWDRRKPRAMPSGATGWVRCRQNSAAGEALSCTHSFRIHVCRQWPCTAMWHPSKYGDVPPPRLHGKIARLCDVGEIVPMETAWSSLLEDIALRGKRDAMSSPTSAVAERAPAGSKRKLSEALQDEVTSAANVVGARAEAEQGVTSGLDAPLPTTLVDAVSEPTPAVAERVKSMSALAVPERASSDAEAIRTRIMARADEISVTGAWIGVLEIMAFCAMNKQRVVLQMEQGTVDPIADLAPCLIDKTWSVQPVAGRMVACRWVRGVAGAQEEHPRWRSDDAGVWHTACWKTCTHYVTAQPLQNELPLHGVGVVAHSAGICHTHD